MGKFGYRIADNDSMLKFIQRGELLTEADYNAYTMLMVSL